MRLFIAIDLSEDLRSKLAALPHELPGAKWVKREQIHLTLRFLGEIAGEKAEEITTRLRVVEVPEFSLRLQSGGYFPPKSRNPRVLWLGTERAAPLVSLKEQIDEVLLELGIDPEERDFHPHITLARLKNAKAADVERFITEKLRGFSAESLFVQNFILYESVLNNRGAEHTAIASYVLGHHQHT